MSKSYAACQGCGSINRYDISRANEATCGQCKAKLPVHGAVAEVDAKRLQKLIAKSPLPVVVDFWAPWCGPCLAFAPSFASVASRMSDQFVFVKANTQDHPDLAAAHNIRGIPTLAVFHHGTEIKRQSGASGGEAFAQWLRAGP